MKAQNINSKTNTKQTKENISNNIEMNKNAQHVKSCSESDATAVTMYEKCVNEVKARGVTDENMIQMIATIMAAAIPKIAESEKVETLRDNLTVKEKSIKSVSTVLVKDTESVVFKIEKVKKQKTTLGALTEDDVYTNFRKNEYLRSERLQQETQQFLKLTDAARLEYFEWAKKQRILTHEEARRNKNATNHLLRKGYNVTHDRINYNIPNFLKYKQLNADVHVKTKLLMHDDWELRNLTGRKTDRPMSDEVKEEEAAQKKRLMIQRKSIEIFHKILANPEATEMPEEYDDEFVTGLKENIETQQLIRENGNIEECVILDVNTNKKSRKRYKYDNKTCEICNKSITYNNYNEHVKLCKAKEEILTLTTDRMIEYNNYPMWGKKHCYKCEIDINKKNEGHENTCSSYMRYINIQPYCTKCRIIITDIEEHKKSCELFEKHGDVIPNCNRCNDKLLSLEEYINHNCVISKRFKRCKFCGAEVSNLHRHKLKCLGYKKIVCMDCKETILENSKHICRGRPLRLEKYRCSECKKIVYAGEEHQCKGTLNPIKQRKKRGFKAKNERRRMKYRLGNPKKRCPLCGLEYAAKHECTMLALDRYKTSLSVAKLYKLKLQLKYFNNLEKLVTLEKVLAFENLPDSYAKWANKTYIELRDKTPKYMGKMTKEEKRDFIIRDMAYVDRCKAVKYGCYCELCVNPKMYFKMTKEREMEVEEEINFKCDDCIQIDYLEQLKQELLEILNDQMPMVECWKIVEQEKYSKYMSDITKLKQELENKTKQPGFVEFKHIDVFTVGMKTKKICNRAIAKIIKEMDDLQHAGTCKKKIKQTNIAFDNILNRLNRLAYKYIYSKLEKENKSTQTIRNMALNHVPIIDETKFDRNDMNNKKILGVMDMFYDNRTVLKESLVNYCLYDELALKTYNRFNCGIYKEQYDEWFELEMKSRRYTFIIMCHAISKLKRKQHPEAADYLDKEFNLAYFETCWDKYTAHKLQYKFETHILGLSLLELRYLDVSLFKHEIKDSETYVHRMYLRHYMDKTTKEAMQKYLVDKYRRIKPELHKIRKEYELIDVAFDVDWLASRRLKKKMKFKELEEILVREELNCDEVLNIVKTKYLHTEVNDEIEEERKQDVEELREALKPIYSKPPKPLNPMNTESFKNAFEEPKQTPDQISEEIFKHLLNGDYKMLIN